MGGDENDHSLSIKPETDKYRTISFLLRNRKRSHTPSNIASTLDIPEAKISNLLDRLHEQQYIEHQQTEYHITPAQASYLHHRLTSIDAAEHLHDTTPDDDAYAEDGWEDDLNTYNSH